MFEHLLTVRLHDTDAAGILYFGSQFRMAHETFEAWIESKGAGIRHFFTADTDFILPIVHAEADYKAPVVLGDKLTVEGSVSRIGDTSFTTRYRFIQEDRQEVGTATLVHVAVNRKINGKIPLPEALRSLLKEM